MNCSQSNGFTCLLAVALAFAVGCGGGDAQTSPADKEISTPAPTQAEDGRPNPGEFEPEEPEVDLHPKVLFETTEGNFTVTLRRDLAPVTVENFLKYVNTFYDGTIFHEIRPGYAIVGGSFTEDDEGNVLLKQALVAIPNEAAKGLDNERGTIAMAREEQDADSACCEFFINLGNNSSFNYVTPEDGVPVWQTEGYCAFGTVDKADWPVLDKIAEKQSTSRNNRDRWPVDTIKIIRARKL